MESETSRAELNRWLQRPYTQGTIREPLAPSFHCSCAALLFGKFGFGKIHGGLIDETRVPRGSRGQVSERCRRLRIHHHKILSGG